MFILEISSLYLLLIQTPMLWYGEPVHADAHLHIIMHSVVITNYWVQNKRKQIITIEKVKDEYAEALFMAVG